MQGPIGIAAAVALFAIGTLGLVLRRDLVIKLLALGLVNTSAILCLLSLDAAPGRTPPFLSPAFTQHMVDPLPQALVLSAIVINFAILALALVFVMRIVEQYHTLDSQRVEHEVEGEDA